MITISVIIPAYNVEKYIDEALESIQIQKQCDIEIICIDDASTDGTLDRIKNHAIKDSRISIIQHDTNMGAAKARNEGARKAKGKYIYFFDADDRLIEGALEILYSTAEENRLDILSFSGEAFSDDGFICDNCKSTNPYERRREYNRVYSGPELFGELTSNEDFYGNLVFLFIRRELFVDNNLFKNEKLRFYDDSPFSIYMAADRAMCISDNLYQRRNRNESQTTSMMTLNKLESYMLGVFDDFICWGNTDLPDSINQIIDQYFNRQYYILRDYYEMLEEDIDVDMVLRDYPHIRHFFGYYIACKSRYNTITQDVLMDIKKAEEIIMYGAGIVANRVATCLENNGIYSYKVVVTDIDDEKPTFRGHRVYSQDDGGIDWNKAFVLVAVSRDLQKSIAETIEKKDCYRVLYV